MNNEYKTIDLCGRLPYGVFCHVYDDNSNGVKLGGIKGNQCYFEALDYKEEDGYVSIEEVKPFLRPMDSMTDAESEEYDLLRSRINGNYSAELGDWLNAHHFDHRGLISQGLALEAPDGMYSVEISNLWTRINSTAYLWMW